MVNVQLQQKIDRAIKLLQSVAKSYDGVFEVAYSGGKDSDVILQLAKEAKIKYKAVYKNTTIDPPGTIKHAQDMGAVILRPKESFLKLVERKGFPNKTLRFCCEVLKEYKTPGYAKCIVGVRRSESRARRERYKEPTQCRGTKRNPYEQVYPLLEWTDEDVRDFILDRGLKCAPTYYDEKGVFHQERRLGCLVCPLVYYKKRIALFRQYPKMLKAYLHAGERFRSKRPDLKTVQNYDDVYEWFVRDLYFGDSKKWKEHQRGNLLFGKPNYKEFLEKTFGIDLTFND